MKVIEILVSPTAETKVETKGFAGNECQKASQFLIGALGNKSTEKLKPEFHTRGDCEERLEQNS